MAVELNHTIVASSDSDASASFVADILGLAEPSTFGPFVTVETANGVTLDFLDDDGHITPQHYAFLVGEDDFDEIFSRIEERNVPYWADPARARPGRINTNDGGRGVYFQGPDGHLLEIITKPYGSGA